MMMTSLFNMFDPLNQTFLKNWISSLIPFLFIPLIIWLKTPHTNTLASSLKMFTVKEFKNLLNKKPFMLFTLTSLLTFILLNNLMGLFPYVFTSTSHLSFTFAIGMPLWMSINLYMSFKKPNQNMAHLIPPYTPYMLMPFMVIIETISVNIRPMTLSIRLAANMIAGHLLLSLCSSLFLLMDPLTIMPTIFMNMFLNILEMSVSMIQAYVFTILAVMYFQETLD